jgi:hydrogenase maturation protease
MSESSRSGTVVVGVGNPLMGDDGLGLAALEILRAEWVFDPAVSLLDGGTWSMNLLPQMEDAERLLLLDAIRAGQPSGTVVRLERDEIPRLFTTKLSPHQIDLREVLALAEWRGTLPTATVAMGVEPERVALGTELSPPVRAALPRLVMQIVRQLEVWGHHARPAVQRDDGMTPAVVARGNSSGPEPPVGAPGGLVGRGCGGGEPTEPR